MGATGGARLICPNCQAANAEDRRFCRECGAAFSVRCAACGSDNGPGDRFCGHCGTTIGPGESAGSPRLPDVAEPAAASPLAERRVVSVLFADLVGFATLAQDRDSESVRELLTAYFAAASEVVERYGGLVEKFIGDAVMAVWGTPTAHEDDAERAVRTALDLVDRVRSLGGAHGAAGLEMRAAVLTGEAAVTLGARGQGMVAGDLVNTASRLQSVAAPGTVLVGESTQRAASGAITFEPAGDHLLKGLSRPVTAYRALRVVAKRGGVGRSEGVEAPFVGRDDELRLLKELFHASARERRIRLVSITGQAGIGKSRLAWEFLKYTDGVLETVFWHQGRSPAFGEGVTFWALGEMVRRRAALLESDDEETTRTRLREMLDDFMGDVPGRDGVEHALLALLGLEQAPSGGRDELFTAWRTFFRSVAHRGPTVLLFEDLHWADGGLLDFIDHLLEWERDLPIYIVTLARPELLERRPDWGAGRRDFLALSLEPLREPHMRELLAGLVPGLPESAARAILARADGVPLYAVETVRMLLAEGRVEERDGAYRPIGDLTELAVPDSLHALIAARLDALDPADRALLQHGAVLGQKFAVSALAAVAERASDELGAQLRSLVRREMLALDADPLSPERGQYGFTQGLMREVAYSTLSRSDRRSRHLAAARYFEALGDEELAGALASHYLDAFHASPEGPQADALAGQARIALRAGADRAIRLGSYEQAVTYLEQALLVTTEEGEQAEILEHMAQSAEAAGRYPQAEDYSCRAMDLYRGRGDRSSLIRATVRLARTLLISSRTDDGLAVLEETYAGSQDLLDEPAAIEMMSQLARAHMFGEEHSEAVEWADRALIAAERHDLLPVIADTLVTKGICLATRGRLREGVGLIEVGQRLAESIGSAETSLRAAVNLSSLLPSIDPRRALELGRAAYELAMHTGRRSLAYVLLGNAAEIAILTGEWDWALTEVDTILLENLERTDRARLLSSAIELRALRGDPVDRELKELEHAVAGDPDSHMVGVGHAARHVVSLAANRPLDACESAVSFARVSSLNAPVAWLDAALAAVLARDPERAREALDASHATGVQGPALTTQRNAIAAGIAGLDGRTKEAMSGFRQARDRFTEQGLLFAVARNGLVAATAVDASDPEVRSLGQEARDIFAMLGAKPFVTQLDEILGRDPSPEVENASVRPDVEPVSTRLA